MKIFLFALTIFIGIELCAQKQEIIELNDAFGGAYEFTWAKKGIEIDFFDKGKVVRHEFFRSSEIDWEKTSYSDEKGAVVIVCKDIYSHCIDRKILKTKSRRPYSNTRLKIGSSVEASTVIEVLKRFSTF